MYHQSSRVAIKVGHVTQPLFLLPSDVCLAGNENLLHAIIFRNGNIVGERPFEWFTRLGVSMRGHKLKRTVHDSTWLPPVGVMIMSIVNQAMWWSDAMRVYSANLTRPGHK